MAKEADLRYTPLCKPLSEVVCFSFKPEDKDLSMKIIENLLNDESTTN